jgi:hypothetical protein
MKRTFRLALCVAALALFMTCGVFAATEGFTEDKDGTLTYDSATKTYTAAYNGATAGSRYLLIVVKGEDKTMDQDKIVDIRQLDNAPGAAISIQFKPMSFSEKCSVWLGGSFSGGVTSPVLLGYLLPNSETQQGGEETVAWGDFDGNGVVDTDDIVALTRAYLEWPEYTHILTEKGADVNCDGEVNTDDIVILTRKYLEWPGYETLPMPVE